MKNYLIAKTDSKSSSKQIIVGQGYRITVLTDRLFRVEVSSDNSFCDYATQTVWFRNVGEVPYTVQHNDNILTITTNRATLNFDTNKCKCTTVCIGGNEVPCNNSHNLFGTARTLDQAKGSVKLGYGVVSTDGVAILEDKSYILLDNGELDVTITHNTDYYVFAHGQDYRAAVNDLYAICGKVPLIPRCALGNWWSRYYAYTQQQYCDLILKFIDRNVPITVATVDMDWHWTDVNDRFDDNTIYDGKVDGTGWTGYSWNTELFPDYKGFLQWLKQHNLKIAVNVHPAEGVRNFEDCYAQMCQHMNMLNKGKTIKFDMLSADFIQAYLEVIHNQYEKDGVDYWWIDWQQGTVDGFDPLWSLNHYHYLNSAREGKRPLILSRYGGVGCHRYPLGFSGDTQVFWSALHYQPYFTATASNIGYTWWSHDIGGHFDGYRDEELYIRWLQLGVFSPICRLHSSSGALYCKEPWSYRKEIERIAIQQLQLRHKLIPYIHSMNYRTHLEGIAICEPMYYSYPDKQEAYECKNQYMFGSQLLVCSVTTKLSKSNNMSQTKVWLPKGRWTDIFTDYVYEGEKCVTLCRELDSIPVLAREGAIIPLSVDVGNSADNPHNLLLWAYRGKGHFDMYEDNEADKVAIMHIDIDEGEELTMHIAHSGATEVMPTNRHITIVFKDIIQGNICVQIDNQTITAQGNSVCFDLTPTQKAIITVANYVPLTNPSVEQVLVDRLCKVRAKYEYLLPTYYTLAECRTTKQLLDKLSLSNLPKAVQQSIIELIDID